MWIETLKWVRIWRCKTHFRHYLGVHKLIILSNYLLGVESSQVIKKFAASYMSVILIKMVRKSHVFWYTWNKSPATRPISLRSTSILSFHLCLPIPSDICRSGLPTKIRCAFLSPQVLLHVSLILSSSILQLSAGERKGYIWCPVDHSVFMKYVTVAASFKHFKRYQYLLLSCTNVSVFSQMVVSKCTSKSHGSTNSAPNV
jgi:hypothetical protein